MRYKGPNHMPKGHAILIDLNMLLKAADTTFLEYSKGEIIQKRINEFIVDFSK